MSSASDVSEKMTTDEDAALRRLHWFQSQGFELAPSIASVATALRARDQRADVREPDDEAVIAVVEDLADLETHHPEGQLLQG